MRDQLITVAQWLCAAGSAVCCYKTSGLLLDHWEKREAGRLSDD